MNRLWEEFWCHLILWVTMWAEFFSHCDSHCEKIVRKLWVEMNTLKDSLLPLLWTESSLELFGNLKPTMITKCLYVIIKPLQKLCQISIFEGCGPFEFKREIWLILQVFALTWKVSSSFTKMWYHVHYFKMTSLRVKPWTPYGIFVNYEDTFRF